MTKNNDLRFAATTFVPAHDEGTALAQDWVILSDFDGTISRCDVIDVLLERFGLPGYEALEDDWVAGRIGSRACLQGQIGLLKVTPQDLDACIDEIGIDPDFVTFAAQVQAMGISLQVVSDGLDHAIHRILGRHGLSDLPVLANHLVPVGEDRWQLEFPHAVASCRQASGNCKCACAERERRPGKRVLFIGDGTSDFCASGVADLVLAKDKLIGYCESRHLPHIPVRSFADALALLPQILAEARDAA